MADLEFSIAIMANSKGNTVHPINCVKSPWICYLLPANITKHLFQYLTSLKLLNNTGDRFYYSDLQMRKTRHKQVKYLRSLNYRVVLVGWEPWSSDPQILAQHLLSICQFSLISSRWTPERFQEAPSTPSAVNTKQFTVNSILEWKYF